MPDAVFNSSNPKQNLGKFKMILQMFKDYFNKEYSGISKSTLLLIGCSIVYFISPVNLSFEWIPFIGQIDDAVILAFLYKQISQELTKYQDWLKTN